MYLSEFKDMNLAAKLASIRKMVPAVRKTKSGYGYKYVPLEELQARVTAAMDKYGVNLYPSVVPGTASIVPYSYTKQKVLKNGEVINETVNEFLYTAETLWHWVNIDNPSDEVIVPWFAAANMSDASQTVNSANTYQSRGFISAFLQTAMTEEDPESYRTKQREAAAEEDRLATEMVVSDMHNYVVAYLANHPDKREEMTALVKDYNKVNGKPSSDYFKMKDPIMATKLFEAIREKFPVNETEVSRQ